MQPPTSGDPAAASFSSSGDHKVEGAASSSAAGDPPVEIREVWEADLEAEMAAVLEFIHAFPIVGMDTEFPGTVVGDSNPYNPPEVAYGIVRANVNRLRLIQLGLALGNENGEIAGGRVWQFNLKFNPAVDECNEDSIDFLNKNGVDFDAQRERGITVTRFEEVLKSIVASFSTDVTWVTFHGDYDIAYLLKYLSGEALPGTLDDFRTLVPKFLPMLYDVKVLAENCIKLPQYSGLDTVAVRLGVPRAGTPHNAGSDALLTLRCYLAMKDNSEISWLMGDSNGMVYGFGEVAPP